MFLFLNIIIHNTYVPLIDLLRKSCSPRSVFHNVIRVPLWLPCVIEFVSHSLPPQMQVPATQSVRAGQTCLCSWLLWWGGTAQQLTHLSLLRWGDDGKHSQVHGYSPVIACERAFFFFFRACAEVRRSDKINYAELGCIIVSVTICHGYMLIAVNRKVFKTKKLSYFPY